MNFMFPSRLIGTVAAIAIAATTLSAAPAYADRDDRAARAIATLLGLAVVGKIIHDKNKGRSDDHVSVRPSGGGHGHGTHNPRPRPLPSRIDRKVLPAQCFYRIPTYRNEIRIFGRRCLQENYRFVDRLPQYCLTRVRSDRRTHKGYDARCLRQNGYRIARN